MHPERTDQDAIAIYRETVEPLYAFVARRCDGQRQLAEDVTQETFLRFVGEYRRGIVPKTPLAWLQTVAHNLLMSSYRKQRPGTMAPEALDEMLTSAEPVSREANHAVLCGLARIKPRWAEMLAAFHLDGRSVSAIAAQMGLSERAVEGQLRRGREALRQRLGPSRTGE